MLEGRLAQTSGQVLLDGIDVVQELPKARQKTGVCPQSGGLWELLTTREVILLALLLSVGASVGASACVSHCGCCLTVASGDLRRDQVHSRP